MGDCKNRLWDMGALGNLPIFNAGKLLGALRASQSIRDQRIIDYQKTILTALTDVENSLLNYKAYSDENELLKSSVENNEKALSLSFSLYQEGLIEFLQVLNAERSLITSKNAFVENKRNILLSVISLYKALGGSLDIPQEGDA